MKHNTHRLVAGVLACLGATVLSAEPLVHSGESIAFLGDSITQYGAEFPAGYVNLVLSGLEANGIKVTAYPAGIAGQTSPNMLARLEKDILSKKPTWMTLSCGVNDVGHGDVTIEQYHKCISAIIDQTQAAGINVLIMTATPLLPRVSGNGGINKIIAKPYNDFLRQQAKEKKCPLADINAEMLATMDASIAALTASGKAVPWTAEGYKNIDVFSCDGCHMNPAGNVVMAISVLRAFGLDDAQIAKAQTVWQDIPNAVPVGVEAMQRLSPMITLRQYEQLRSIADKQQCSVSDLSNQLLVRAIAGATLVHEPTPADHEKSGKNAGEVTHQNAASDGKDQHMSPDATSVQSGDSIVLFGDEFTRVAALTPGGYGNLVACGLESNGIKASVKLAYHWGSNKSDLLLKRLDADVLKQKPTRMTICCGSYDVYWGGTPLDQYKTNMTAIVDQAQAAGINVVIVTAPLIMYTTDINHSFNRNAEPYNEFLRSLAKEKHCNLADLNADMRAGMAHAGEEACKRGDIFMSGAMTLNPAGSMLMATGILQAFGLSEAQLARAHEAWLAIPASTPLTPKTTITLRQFNQFQALAVKQGCPVPEILTGLMQQEVADTIAKTSQP